MKTDTSISQASGQAGSGYKVGISLTQDRTRKGELKMRGLAEEIRAFAEVCQSILGVVRPGPSLEMEHLDSVVNALDRALVTIRTLDGEVFERSDNQNYRTLRASEHAGRVVRGMTGPRNNSVHHAAVVDPDLARAVGPLAEERFIIFPRWKQRSELPAEMFEYHNGPRKGQEIVEYTAAFDAAVAGRLILDSLLDAFAFFNNCAPALAPRNTLGEIEGFPLAPLPVATGYYRLHPDWLTHEQVDKRIRSDAMASRPAGTERRITGGFTSKGELVVFGYTQIDASRSQAFTEPLSQVLADLELGYPYQLIRSNTAIPIEPRDGELWVENRRLSAAEVAKQDADISRWKDWWQLACGDADYYRKQRLLS